jgi:hypothetical protein
MIRYVMHMRRILIVHQLSRYTKLLIFDSEDAVVIHSIKVDLTPALGTTSLVSSMILNTNPNEYA